MPVVIPSTKVLHWALVDDPASALIRYTGPWSVAESGKEGSSNSRRSEAETNAHEGSSARWIDSNGSLSVDFDGYEGSLIGGMSFTPTADFAFCTIDGVTVPRASAGSGFMASAPRAQGLNARDIVPLCHVTGLQDGPHVLTFNVTDLVSSPSSAPVAGPNSDDSANRVWIDGFTYATSRWPLAARQAPSVSSTSPSSATPTSAGNSTSGNSNDSGTSSKTAARIGEIAGGIIGGALLVVALRGLFFYIQRNDGTRTAVGRPVSPTYESGWTLPKFGKSAGKGGKTSSSLDVSGGDAKHTQKGTGVEMAADVPLSPLKEDHGKVSTEHAVEAPETGARIPAA